MEEHNSSAVGVRIDHRGQRYYALCAPDHDDPHPRRLAVVTVVTEAMHRDASAAFQYTMANESPRTVREKRHPIDVATQLERRARQMGGVRERNLLELAAKIRGGR